MTDPLLRVQSQLTSRDHVLLGWLADHGVLTSFQIAYALFPSLDYAQQRLTKLVRLRVLDRFRPQRAEGGSYPYHYVLAQLGVEVVPAQRGDQPFSLDAQRAALDKYVRSQSGWTIVAEYEDDASGATTARPGLQKALNAAKAGLFDILLVYRIDRFSRSVANLLELIQTLEESGVEFSSATPGRPGHLSPGLPQIRT